MTSRIDPVSYPDITSEIAVTVPCRWPGMDSSHSGEHRAAWAELQLLLLRVTAVALEFRGRLLRITEADDTPASILWFAHWASSTPW
jgi:hypothetical protein